MIQTGHQVPSNYYTRSRDFQLIGRIFDTVFNSSKTYSDLIRFNVIGNNTDKRLLDLITKTIGFDAKRQYDVQDLYTLCNTFKSIIMEKGTEKSINDCVRVLLKAQNINKNFEVVIDNDSYIIGIYIPKELNDVALLEDMLDYVLPIGYTYSIVVVNNTKDVGEIDANIDVELPIFTKYKDKELGFVYHKEDVVADSTPYETENSVVYSDDN